ncbi:NAD(+) diphosphatase [Halioxenophilus aromaticivorans]|uniref:NAD(+) diphosphatase n=1 Tax=Halioxenophilus aromaticivorans TaxID=1306992 RepID=A0AAV3TXC2_9ALTE
MSLVNALYIVVHQGRLLCLNGDTTQHSGDQLTAIGVERHTLTTLAQNMVIDGGEGLFLLPLIAPDSAIDSLVADPSQPWHWADLREFLIRQNEREFHIHARAVQYFHWLREHRFCGICGSTTVMAAGENALQCNACGKHWFPRIQPCIITLIHNQDQVLLAKHSRYTANMYSCIAGFAESGESLEQTLHREVYEEVGLQVHNLRYFGSQAWPFPYQLMVGFYAQYKSGEICIDQDEIADARWWSIHDLPERPPTTSISGQLIEHYVANPQLNTSR